MWKIFFEYRDKSKCTITGRHKDIPLGIAKKYYNQFLGAVKATYQQYPKKNHKPMDLIEKIEELESE